MEKESLDYADNTEVESKRKDISKECDTLFELLDEKSLDIVQKLLPLLALLNDSLMHDIHCGLNELLQKGCNKCLITFVGETAEGETIKAKEELVVHLMID
jgi:hypothetical protein